MSPHRRGLFRCPTDRRDLSGEQHLFQNSGYFSGKFMKPPPTLDETHLNCTYELSEQKKDRYQFYSDVGNKEGISDTPMPSDTIKKAAKKAVFPGDGGRLGRFLTSLFHHKRRTFGKKEHKAKSVKSNEEEHSSCTETYGWKKRQQRWRKGSSAIQFNGRASVSSEPMGESRAPPAMDLSKPRTGTCGGEFAVPFLGDRSKRVHVRELVERGLELFDINDDQVEKRWTLNKGGAGMVVVTEEMVEGVVRPKGRRGHPWRREEVEEEPWRRRGEGREEESSDDDDDKYSCDLFELPVFDGAVGKVEEL